MNIALISPSQNAYSETFIQAHKNGLEGNIFFYYGTLQNQYLEGCENLKDTRKKNIYKIKRKLFNKSYSWYHQQFIQDSFIKNKIEVVLVEYGTTAQTYLPLIKELKLPLVVHFHGYDASIFEVIEGNSNYTEVFKYATYIIAVSRKMEKKLLELGCPNKKLVYNVYGPKNEFLDIKPNFNKPQFISIGRFVDKKAPYYTILAFKRVLEEFSDAKLIMAGNGPLLNMCKNLVNHYGIGNSVEFAGIINSEQYREYLEESLAFVQHSIIADNGDSEGTPVAVLEASAAGLPVISTIHAGIPDVIRNKETGLLVEEHDVVGMSNNMMILLKDLSLAKEIGKSGKENIKTNFTLQRHIDVLDSLIKKCVI